MTARRGAAGKAAVMAATDVALSRQVQKLKAALADDVLRAEVESWPPLSPSQRDRLTVLLRGDAA